jgi:hypothetical protein
MIYLEEKQIIRLVKREVLPVVFNPCPVDKKNKTGRDKELSDQHGESLPRYSRKVYNGHGTRNS